MKRLGILAILALMVCMAGAYAATFASPTSSSSISGLAEFNVTSATMNVSNCTVTCSSAGTGGSFAIYLTNSTIDAGSSSQAYANRTWVNTTQVADAADYTCSGTCYNNSWGEANANAPGSEAITAITSLTIDNQRPVCNWSSTLVSNSKYSPTQVWLTDCTNATSATIRFGGNAPVNMVEASDVCTYTPGPGDLAEGSYDLILVTTSDGTNTTTCQLSSIVLEIGNPLKQVGFALNSAAGASSGAAKKVGNQNMTMIVIIGIVALWWVKKKGK